ncbi:MAG TPA: hypothetical protein VEY70_13240 [Metabacillus sp.]|nr:hypothetical protein [Metabacillus sp.]
MRVAAAMKSNFAFERLIAMIVKGEFEQTVETYSDNVQNPDDLEDAIEFGNVQLIIIDTKLPDYENIQRVAEKHDLSTIYFESDFELVLERIAERFNKGTEDNSTKRAIRYIEHKENTKPEVIYKERIVEKEIFRTSYTSIRNKLIVVASMWQGAGATTFATNLARAIANRGLSVAYVEYPMLKPYMFDYLSIPQKEVQREQKYTDFAARLKNGEKIRRREEKWNEHGVDWYVIDSRNEPISEFTYDDMLNFIYSINATYTIVDVSSYLHDKHVQSFLHHADEIFVCVEGDIVKVDWMAAILQDGRLSPVQRKEKETIDYLNQIEQKEGVSFEFINMKYTKKIDNKTFWDCLQKKPILFFPAFHYETLISHVWNSSFLYDEYQQELENIFKPVLVRVLPRQFYQVEKNEKSKKVSNIFRILKRGD